MYIDMRKSNICFYNSEIFIRTDIALFPFQRIIMDKKKGTNKCILSSAVCSKGCNCDFVDLLICVFFVPGFVIYIDLCFAIITL